MEVLAISFFFIFSLSVLMLGVMRHSTNLHIIAGLMFLLLGYLLWQYGITETTLLGKIATQNFTYTLNESTNISSISSITTTENYTNVLAVNDYTTGYGTISILLGVLLVVIPVIQSWGHKEISI